MAWLFLSSASQCSWSRGERCIHKYQSPCEWRDRTRRLSFEQTMSLGWWPNTNCGSSHKLKSLSLDWMELFMEDFLSVPPRMDTISSIDSKQSSYCTVIGCEGGRTFKNSYMLSLVITNSLCLTQQFIWSLSTLAFKNNSLMISKYTNPFIFSSFVHVLYLNTSGMFGRL